MPVDPQVAAFLERIAALNAPPIYTLSPAEARKTVPQIPPPYESVAQVEDRRIPGKDGEIPVRIYTPLAAVRLPGHGPLPMMVFFHGGGWMVADVQSYEHLARIFANAMGCIVVSVEYRLCPEHRFPAGLEDCYAATVWSAENARALGGDPRGIVVCGDSAGANLAAAVSLMARDRQGPPIAWQLLIYPVADNNFDTVSYQQNATGYMLTQAAMRWYWEAYLPPGSTEPPPYAAILKADLKGLPPAHVITAEFDPLRDEGEAFVERLKMAGVPVTFKRYDGMIHGFVRRTDLFATAGVAIKEMAQAMQSALHSAESH